MNYMIEIDNKNYKLVLKNKRINNIRMKIDMDNIITISGYNITYNKAIKFIYKNIDWLRKRIINNDKRNDNYNIESLRKYDKVFLFGDSYIIRLTDNPKLDFSIYKENDYNYILLFDKERNEKMLKRVRNHYLEQIITIYNKYEKIYQRKTILEFKDMISKHGYCLFKLNKIVLSKRLIHLPIDLIEYVIIHEFSHFVVPNHSRVFYQEVNKYCSNYKERIKRLKDYSIICRIK